MGLVTRHVARLVLVVAAVVAGPIACTQASVEREASFRVELGQGQDPSIVWAGGFYNLVQSTPDALAITVRRSRSLATLWDAPEATVWRGGKSGTPCCELWAPDLKLIAGRWFIYFAAHDGDNRNHRMFVVEARKPQGPYSFRARLITPKDRWAIDGTVLENSDGRLYFLWSGWPGDVNVRQNLYIAPMPNPWTVSSPRKVLSKPTHAWERHGRPDVNEGPAVLEHDGTIFVSYSGSGCWTPDYALGLLEAKAGADLMMPESWRKHPAPVFASRGDAGVYGPGHNQFFESPDGSEDWFVYHAVPVPEGDCGGLRTVRAQRISWPEGSGAPDFGAPLAPGTKVQLPAGDPGA